MKKVIFILVIILIIVVINNNVIKDDKIINNVAKYKGSIDPTFYEKSDDDYYKSGFKEDLIEIKNIIENDELMNSISENLHTEILDFEKNETNTVAYYTIEPKFGVQRINHYYGSNIYLEKNLKKNSKS